MDRTAQRRFGRLGIAAPEAKDRHEYRSSRRTDGIVRPTLHQTADCITLRLLDLEAVVPDGPSPGVLGTFPAASGRRAAARLQAAKPGFLRAATARIGRFCVDNVWGEIE